MNTFLMIISFTVFNNIFSHFQEARQALEKQKQLAKQNQEKENKEKLEALNKLKEARAAENEAKRLENERKLQEAEERRKIGKAIFQLKISPLDGDRPKTQLNSGFFTKGGTPFRQPSPEAIIDLLDAK